MKGQKTGGRIKGTPNKMTTMNRELLKNILEDNVEDFKAKFKGLKPKDFCDVFLQMMKYVLPQLSNVTLDSSEENKNSIIEILKSLSNEK
jgi:hypothetical protein